MIRKDHEFSTGSTWSRSQRDRSQRSRSQRGRSQWGRSQRESCRGLAIVAALLVTASAWAHHGHPHYFRGSYTHMEGTITEVHWLNPHTWVYLEVAGADGQSTVWALEGAGVTTLLREGWTHEMVQVGDTISVRCHPLKDGSPGCLLGYITMENGEEKEFD